MDKLLFLKIIDFIKSYGLQVIGIIIIIFLSKYFIQALLWVIKLLVYILLGVINIVFIIIRFILTIMPASLQDKMNKLIVKVESFIRSMENTNRRVKAWFAAAPSQYANVHRYITKFIKSAVVLFFLFSILVLVVNVFIQKSLSAEKILTYLSL
jgi:hypothetical protein